MMRLTLVLAYGFALCSLIIGLLPLHAGVGKTLGKTIWMEYAYILQYDYSVVAPPGMIPEPHSWASLYVLYVCTGSQTRVRQCYKTHKGDFEGSSLRQDGKDMHFFTTGTLVEVGLSLQTLMTLIILLGRLLMPLLCKWQGWKLRWTRPIVPFLMVGTIGSLLAVIAGTKYINDQTHTIGLDVTYSKAWIGLLWATLPLTVAALVFEILEANKERTRTSLSSRPSKWTSLIELVSLSKSS